MWCAAVCTAVSLAVAGQEPADTMQTNISLNEVEIEADRQYTDTRTTTYIPTSRQKNAAQNAMRLLSFMAIPQIRVNPQNETIESNAGNAIDIYINYLPATKEDLNGLNPKDVKKVEYIEMPVDPRFRNARAVVSITTVRYEWGGYTKIMPEIQQGTFTSPTVQVFSKFAYKKMIYDFSGLVGGNSDHSFGYDQIAEYMLPDNDGNLIPVTEDKRLTKGRYRHISEQLHFRAIYATEKSQIHNTVTFRAFQNPKAQSIYDISLNDGALFGGTEETLKSGHTTSLGWRGDYFWMLPANWNLMFAGELIYSHANNKSRQFLDEQLVINNPTIENAIKYGAYLGAQKSFGQHHSLTPYITFGEDYNKIRYTGDAATDMRYKEFDFSACVNYEYRANKWLAGIEASWRVLWTGVNGQKYDVVSQPAVTANFNYSPTNKHQMFVSASYDIDTPSSALRNPTMTQVDLLMWTVGNPDLKSSPKLSVGAGYTWLPSNKWQFSFNGGFSRNWRRMATEYLPEGPDHTLLTRRINCGAYNYGNISANGTLRLLNNSLVLQVSPSLNVYSIDADQGHTLVVFNAWVNASYFIGNCYINPYYITPSKTLTPANGQEASAKSSYGVGFGWYHKNLNVALSVRNFARWHDRDTRSVLSTPYFNRIYLSRLGNSHASFSLSVTYTFNYGKKISAENESFNTGKTSSAVLEE